MVTASRDRYLVLPDGSIAVAGVHRGANRQAVPPTGAFWVEAPDIWVRGRDEHVEFGEGSSVIWRSRDRYDVASGDSLWAPSYAPAGVAFQLRRAGPLYMAPGDGPEHRVASDETPAEWTHAGTLLTFAKGPAGYTMRLRAADGSLIRTLGTGLTIDEVSARGRSGDWDLYLADGKIWRTDGAHVRAIANLQELGFSSTPDLYPIGGRLIEVLGRNWYDVIIRLDGSVFAAPTPAPASGYAAFGYQVADPSGSVVAYQVMRESTSRSTVFLLHEGQKRGIPALRLARVNPCDTPFSWYGSWLLFRNLAGSSYAIPSGGGPPIRLPARIDGERVIWARWAPWTSS
jgi:hypothetical protein